MKTVLQSLKQMEACVLNQPEIDALEQIETLKAKLGDRPGAPDILMKLLKECAPEAEKAKTELAVIRDAIQILEDEQTVPEAPLVPEFQAESLPVQETESLAVAQPA